MPNKSMAIDKYIDEIVNTRVFRIFGNHFSAAKPASN